MTEEERLEDEALKKCIQEAYGCSDEQLLAELDELEATISDSDFPGAEERICQKLLARAAEEESAKQEESRPSDIIEPVSAGMPPAAPVRLPDGAGEKRSRFGKKKVFLVAVLAAAFVAMLGVTAIGGKSYFFRIRISRNGIIINNDQHVEYAGNLETAYNKIEEELGINAIKLNYLPSDMKFDSLVLEKDRAVLNFSYGENMLYVIQMKKEVKTSLAAKTDRIKRGVVHNDWLNTNIEYSSNTTELGQKEYEAILIRENELYYIFGVTDEEEFINILKKINFY